MFVSVVVVHSAPEYIAHARSRNIVLTALPVRCFQVVAPKGEVSLKRPHPHMIPVLVLSCGVFYPLGRSFFTGFRGRGGPRASASQAGPSNWAEFASGPLCFRGRAQAGRAPGWFPATKLAGLERSCFPHCFHSWPQGGPLALPNRL